MDKFKDKGALIICAVAIVLIIVLLVAKGGNKKQEQNNTQNNSVQNSVSSNVDNTAENNTLVEEFVEKQEDGSKVNTSEQLKKTKTIDGLEITNIRLVESGGLSQIVADVKNTTSTTKGDFDITITALDKNGNKIASLSGYIDRVAPGKTAQLNASVTTDMANAYDFTVEKK